MHKQYTVILKNNLDDVQLVLIAKWFNHNTNTNGLSFNVFCRDVVALAHMLDGMYTSIAKTIN